MRRVVTSTMVVALSLTFAACGSDDTSPDAADTPTPTPAAETPAPEPEAMPESTEQADLAEIETVFAGYWNAVIESENGPTADQSLFDGVATGAAIEMQLTNVNSLIKDGIRRVGTPALSEPAIHLKGDDARVEVCVDSSTWGAAVGDHTAPPQPSDPQPRVVDMERIDDQWLVTEQIDPSEATITC